MDRNIFDRYEEVAALYTENTAQFNRLCRSLTFVDGKTWNLCSITEYEALFQLCECQISEIRQRINIMHESTLILGNHISLIEGQAERLQKVAADFVLHRHGLISFVRIYGRELAERRKALSDDVKQLVEDIQVLVDEICTVCSAKHFHENLNLFKKSLFYGRQREIFLQLVKEELMCHPPMDESVKFYNRWSTVKRTLENHVIYAPILKQYPRAGGSVTRYETFIDSMLRPVSEEKKRDVGLWIDMLTAVALYEDRNTMKVDMPEDMQGEAADDGTKEAQRVWEAVDILRRTRYGADRKPLMRHQYDMAWIADFMDEQRRKQPGKKPFADTKDFIDFLRKGRQSGVPDTSTINKYRVTQKKAFPDWVFTDAMGQRSTEIERRKELVRQFQQLMDTTQKK